jgi:hypothetical protein
MVLSSLVVQSHLQEASGQWRWSKSTLENVNHGKCYSYRKESNRTREEENEKYRALMQLAQFFCLGRIETRNINGFGSNSSNGFFKH